MDNYDKLQEQYKELLKEYKQLCRDYVLACKIIRNKDIQIKILMSTGYTNKQKKSLLSISGTNRGGKVNATTN